MRSVVVFALIGALIFAADRGLRSQPERRVVITADFVEGLRADFARQNGRYASEEETRALVDGYVEEDLLYREALALGLDRGDPIVRKRLVQKMRFVAYEAEAEAPPVEAALVAWMAAHPADFVVPARTTFEHVFFRADTRGARAEADAKAALAAAAPAGDPFVMGSRFEDATAEQIDGTFGPGFASALASLPLGAWAGPVRSSYGAHLVRVVSRAPERLARLDEVRARVEGAVLDARRAEARAKKLAELRARYEVVVEQPAPAVAAR